MNIQILIIDDSQEDRDRAKKRLEEVGYTVMCMSGLQHIVQEGHLLTEVDVIILDLCLGEISGFFIARELRRHGMLTPMILWSAARQSTPTLTKLAKLLGMTFVSKTRDVDGLVQAVSDLKIIQTKASALKKAEDADKRLQEALSKLKGSKLKDCLKRGTENTRRLKNA